MSRFPSFTQSIGVTLLCCLCVSVSIADDWNQWMGPTRDGVYREAGIVDSIPAGGLPVRWRVPVFGGYAGPAVVGDRVYLMDYERTKGEMIETPDARPEQEGFERVRCFDANTGNQIWEHKYAVNYKISYPAGPRATPTVIDGVVVTLGAEGDLIALNASNGELKWQVNLPKTFNAKTPIWGFAAHPLVTDSMVVTMVGGDNQAAVAFDRATGKVLWKSVSSSDAGYCPPSLIQAGGTEQLLIWHPDAVASLDPATGKAYWTEPLKPDYGMSIAQPMREGDHLFVTGIENKSMMLKLASDRPAANKLWDSEPKTSISCSTMTPVIHDGLIFGCDESLGAVVCAKVFDGERLWHNWLPVRPDNQRRLSAGNAFITRHAPSGRYLLFGETGLLTLAEMTAEGFRSLGQMQVVEPTQTAFGRKVIWSHPAYARQTAFIRNDRELVAVDLSGGK